MNEMDEQPKEEQSELEKLVKEKIRLSKKLGLIDKDRGPIEGYKDTTEYKRIFEIDSRLWELVK